MPAAKSPATFTPLVAEGLALIAEVEAKKTARDNAAAFLADAQAALDAVNAKIVALGAGRYRDEEDHTCLVVAGFPASVAPDRFALPPGVEALERIREISGESFLKLFDRKISYEAKPGFDGIAGAILTPARARDVLDLCRIRGGVIAGRRAYVKWR